MNMKCSSRAIAAAIVISLSTSGWAAAPSLSKAEVQVLEASREINCLRAAVAVEAGTDTLRGRMEVAYSILRRTKDKQYPSSICAVTHEAWQYTAVHNQRAVGPVILARATDAVLLVLAYPAMSHCPGATSYYASYIKKPYWAYDMKRVCHVGKHIFFAPKPPKEVANQP